MNLSILLNASQHDKELVEEAGLVGGCIRIIQSLWSLQRIVLGKCSRWGFLGKSARY
jgi:hypothetical protein